MNTLLIESRRSLWPLRNRNAFSLVEILVVIAIIGCLTVLATASYSHVFESLELNRGAQQLTDALEVARQHAIVTSRPVRFCFYETANGYRMFQSFVRNEKNEWTPLIPAKRLPDSIRIKESDPQLYSTLIHETTRLNQTDLNQLPKSLGVTAGRSFQFLGDGSTNLSVKDGDTWHITLCSIHQSSANGGGLPSNFITVQIDPAIGNVRGFKP